ncbi:MAG: PQQ-binding-like beta-propeller repeat protein [Planctomycetia bacterium]
MIHGIELVRAVEPPPLLSPTVKTTAEWRPADLAWEGSGKDSLRPQPDGSVRLAQPDEAVKSPLVAMWKLPPSTLGPREIVVRITDVMPGTGVCLGGPDGKPALVLGFVEPAAGGPADRKGNLFLPWTPDKSPLTGGDPKNLGFAFAPRTFWLRCHAFFDGYNDVVSMSWSVDGRAWARPRQLIGWQGCLALGSVGLFVGGHPGRAATLTQVAVADMPGFARILPRDLLAAVEPKLMGHGNPNQSDAWHKAVLTAKPADVAESRWLAAAAIRSLATNCVRIRELPLLAWQHAQLLDLSLAEQIAVCDDLNRYVESSGVYGVCARRCIDRGDLEGFRTIWRALQHAPSDTPFVIDYFQRVDPLEVSQRMLRRLFVSGPAADLRREASRHAFYLNGTNLPTAMVRQIDAERPVGIESRRLLNAAGDFHAAIADAAWNDAHRAAGWAAELLADDLGQPLVPHPDDAELLQSFPLAVASAVADHAEFRGFIQQDPADRGRLRLTQLVAAADASGIARAALEFQGTPAAAEAREWLARRVLATGDCTTAREHARSGLDGAAADVRARLLAIIALADAVGRAAERSRADAGSGPISAAEIAAVVAAVPPPPPAEPPPPPAGDVDIFKRLDLGPGAAPVNGGHYPPALFAPWDQRFDASFKSPPFTLHRLDWAGEVCAITPAAGRVLVGNRLELAAVDPQTGKELWRTPAVPNPPPVSALGLVPLRPGCDERHAFVRRLAADGRPTLIAVRLADGSVAWESRPAADRTPVSDPVVVDGAVRICEIQSGAPDTLVLTTLDPTDGKVMRSQPLCHLLADWQVVREHRPYPGDCQIAAHGGRLFVTTSGAVICCDANGQPLWLRHQPWLGQQTDAWWSYQAPTPPLVRDGAVYVVQPGVHAVTALDAATGRLRWRTPLPLVRRLVGVAGGGDAARLVVEAGDGLFTVDPRDGDARLILAAADGPGTGFNLIAPSRLLGPALAMPDGGLVVAVERRRPDTATSDTLDAALLWVDTATGAVRHETLLPPFAGKPSWVGPLAAASGRLWALTHASNPADPRRTLWELAPKPAP